jgi:hypothetical protein
LCDRIYKDRVGRHREVVAVLLDARDGDYRYRTISRG